MLDEVWGGAEVSKPPPLSLLLCFLLVVQDASQPLASCVCHQACLLLPWLPVMMDSPLQNHQPK